MGGKDWQCGTGEYGTSSHSWWNKFSAFGSEWEVEAPEVEVYECEVSSLVEVRSAAIPPEFSFSAPVEKEHRLKASGGSWNTQIYQFFLFQTRALSRDYRRYFSEHWKSRVGKEYTYDEVANRDFVGAHPHDSVAHNQVRLVSSVNLLQALHIIKRRVSTRLSRVIRGLIRLGLQVSGGKQKKKGGGQAGYGKTYNQEGQLLLCLLRQLYLLLPSL